jgi:hypothetical protein
MKKKNRLQIKKITLRDLDEASLAGLAGGTRETAFPTCCCGAPTSCPLECTGTCVTHQESCGPGTACNCTNTC